MALSNEQYESIIKKYERTSDYNRIVSQTRREEVYHKISGFQELEASVGTISAASARSMLEGDDNALPKLRRKLAEIADTRKRLLIEHGFPSDYLEPIYSCPACRDTGYVAAADGLKEKCRCFRQQEISILYAQSNIQDTIAKENFSTLSYEYYQKDDLRHFETAVELCHKFIQAFHQDYHNLFFYGTVGTGKSFLSGCIAKELLEQGSSVIYFSAAGLFELLARYSFDVRNKESLYGLYEDLYGCDLLIIDDLGTEITNSFVTSQLFSCLNERHLRKKSSLISTNISLEELRDRYSDRIFSRITSSFILCKLTGPDIRILKKRLSGSKAMQSGT